MMAEETNGPEENRLRDPGEGSVGRASQASGLEKKSRQSVGRASQGSTKQPSQHSAAKLSQEEEPIAGEVDVSQKPSETEKEETLVSSSRMSKSGSQDGSTGKSGNDEKDEEFRFYLQFVKSLVFYIRDLNERGAVSSWILKLQKATKQPELRVEYVKLLLFCLQRRRLPCMFAEKPDDNTDLEDFPVGLQVNDMMRQIIENDISAESGQGDENVVSETSADLKEYVAIQKIPCYGVHCYMAVSDEPLNKWDHYVKESNVLEKTKKLDKECEGLPAARPPGVKDPEFYVYDEEKLALERRKLECKEGTSQKTRLAGGGGGGAPIRHQCCRLFTPSNSSNNESEIEDDYLVVDGDEIRPSYAPIITRLRNKNRPPKAHPEGPESRASQRTVREENMVDVRGNAIKSTILGQGVIGSYTDPRDGITIRMRKTMAARDFDSPRGKTKCVKNLPKYPQQRLERPRQRQEETEDYEPSYEYVQCPQHPSRSRNEERGFHPATQSRYSPVRNTNYQCPNDDYDDEDFSEYDERIDCPGRWQ